MARVLVCQCLDSQKAVKDICDQRILSDRADAQADRSLRKSNRSYCRFCRALGHDNKIHVK